MTDIMVFESQQFGKVRTVRIGGEPWFVSHDVCKVLGISNPSQAIKKLDDDERGTLILNEGYCANPIRTTVNEPGLYSLVLSSRKPEAKAFKRWITHDVIPAIRKTGGYIAGEEHMADDELMAKALIVANNKLLQREQHIKALEAKIQDDAPKVLFADSVATSQQSILFRQLALILRQNGMDIGQQRLFQRLRDEGYLCSTRGERYNTPTQRAMDLKLFEVKETTVNTPDGIILRMTTKVTPKGQVYFVNRYIGT